VLVLNLVLNIETPTVQDPDVHRGYHLFDGMSGQEALQANTVVIELARMGLYANSAVLAGPEG
jgi:hypothetical protein